LAAVIAFLIYPTAFFVIKDPASIKWARAHGFSLMPDSEQLPMEDNGRRLYFVKFAVVALLLYGWARVFGVPLCAFVLHTEPGQRRGLIVLASTAILAIGHLSVLYHFKRVRKHLLNHGLSRGHLLTWIAIILTGGVVEETWRAVTLSASLEAGFNSSIFVVATSVAFVFCRLLGIPSRNPGVREEVFWEFAVGLALGALFVLSRTILIPLCVNVAYNSLNLTLVRCKLIPIED
jgi:hypothetical protein